MRIKTKCSVYLLFIVLIGAGACGEKKDHDCTNPTKAAIKNQTDGVVSVRLTADSKDLDFADVAKSTTTEGKEVAFSTLENVTVTILSGTAMAGTVTLVNQQNNEISVFADKAPTVSSTAMSCSGGGGSGGGFW